jgi:hypothetical protein
MIPVLMACLCLAAEPPDAASPLGTPAERAVLNAVWSVLQSNPDIANHHRGYLAFLDTRREIAFLERPRRPAPTPEALYPLAAFLKENGDVRETLLSCFQRLHEQPAAHAELFPWWERLGPTRASPPSSHIIDERQDEVAKAYQSMMDYFARRPHEFWVWHGRAAGTAQGRTGRTGEAVWSRARVAAAGRTAVPAAVGARKQRREAEPSDQE